MLPEDGRVLLMHADRVRQRARAPVGASDGCPVDERADSALVAVAEADLVQGEPLDLIEPETEPPSLPFDGVAVDAEARPFGLRDHDGLLGCAGKRKLVSAMEDVPLPTRT